MKVYRLLLVGLAVLTLVGCNAAPATGAQETHEAPPAAPTLPPTATLQPSATLKLVATVVPETPQETPVMNAVPISTPLDPYTEKIVAQAQADLAQQLAIEAGQITFLDAADVTWPDGSLGCPQPGMLYTQVQVEGILIHFQVGSQIYEYHGGGTRAPFLCKQAIKNK